MKNIIFVLSENFQFLKVKSIYLKRRVFVMSGLSVCYGTNIQIVKTRHYDLFLKIYCK